MAIDHTTTYNLYIVGGAAMVLYYNVRESSMDVDGSWDVNNVVVNKAIDYAADINNINKSWLNSDYEKSPSYTPAIYTNSIFYDQIHNVRFHIVRPELALCMKIIAFRGRRGKYDRADAHSLVII